MFGTVSLLGSPSAIVISSVATLVLLASSSMESLAQILKSALTTSEVQSTLALPVP